jgi:hypothetical protein
MRGGGEGDMGKEDTRPLWMVGYRYQDLWGAGYWVLYRS